MSEIQEITDPTTQYQSAHAAQVTAAIELKKAFEWVKQKGLEIAKEVFLREIPWLQRRLEWDDKEYRDSDNRRDITISNKLDRITYNYRVSSNDPEFDTYANMDMEPDFNKYMKIYKKIDKETGVTFYRTLVFDRKIIFEISVPFGYISETATKKIKIEEK